MNEKFIKNCEELISAYKDGKLGQTIMPEDSNPGLEKMDTESRLAYFTLPMALNYQRDSYKLWQSALKTFNDKETNFVFDINKNISVSKEKLREAFLKHKLALQPNKHIDTWFKISKTVKENWGSFNNFIKFANSDFLILQNIIQKNHKKDFPYLSGPKIFNYWSFILSTYRGVKLKNRNYIEIAPDTHITQCSVRLGIIKKAQLENISKEKLSEKWRKILERTGIDPIDMHPPLWFWSRNGFIYKLK